MHNKNFKKQILEFNKFLKSNKNNINIVALSFLHILRPQYDLIKNFNNFNLKYRVIYHFKFTLNKIFKNLIIKREKKKYLSKKVDLLIISNLTNINNLNKKNDFYFGKLQTDLNKKGINCHTVFRNFTKVGINEIRKKNKIINHYFLDDFDTIKNEIKYLFIAISEFLKFKLNKFDTIKINQFKKKFTFFNFLTGISSLRVSNLIINFIKKNNPKIVLITLEGHAWEKVLTFKLKKEFSNLTIIGYQFSVISKNTNSLFLKLGKNYETDYIFTKNKIHKKLFVKKGFNPEKIKVLGNLKKSNIKIVKNNKLNNIIICPEALDYENEIMFNFAKKCAEEIKDYNFIFRPHPSYNKKFLSVHKNLLISKKSLQDDLIKSKILIYRGSSVCFEASTYKILPLYLKIKNEISIDPLYKFQKKEFEILVVSDLKEIIYNTPKISNKIKMLSKKNMQFNEKPNISIINKILND